MNTDAPAKAEIKISLKRSACLFPLASRLLKQWTKKLGFPLPISPTPQSLQVREEGGWELQPEGEPVSLREIPDNSDKVSDRLSGETAADTWEGPMGRIHFDQNDLADGQHHEEERDCPQSSTFT